MGDFTTGFNIDYSGYDDGTFVEPGDSNWDYYIDPETGAYLPVNPEPVEPATPDFPATGCEANEQKTDKYGDTCETYWTFPHWCGTEEYNTADFDSARDCCAC